MTPQWPRALGQTLGTAVLRNTPEDFEVREYLGFEPDGDGEHVFLHLQKRQLNTLDLVQRVSKLSGVPSRDIGYSGLKDRNALTSQWLSVGLAGRPEPDWAGLEVDGKVRLLSSDRHRKKLKRGVHRANEFRLSLVGLQAEQGATEQRLEAIAREGVPSISDTSGLAATGRRWHRPASGPGRAGGALPAIVAVFTCRHCAACASTRCWPSGCAREVGSGQAPEMR